MKAKFCLHRNVDITGISGEGKVVEGVVLKDGSIQMTWLTDTPSFCRHNDMEAVKYIHGHNGNTEIVFITENADFPIIYNLRHRKNPHGLSRVGVVASIAQFSNGACVLHWDVIPFGVEWYLSIENLYKVHCSNDYATIDVV